MCEANDNGSIDLVLEQWINCTDLIQDESNNCNNSERVNKSQTQYFDLFQL